jgi:hypothetical protein
MRTTAHALGAITQGPTPVPLDTIGILYSHREQWYTIGTVS